MRAARPSPTRRRWGRSGTPSRRCRGSRCPDVEASEEDDAALSFAVTLDPAATGRVTVDYATADWTATAGSDYTTTSGTLTFAAGETSKTVSVPITDDSLEDEGETLTLRLSKAPAPGCVSADERRRIGGLYAAAGLDELASLQDQGLLRRCAGRAARQIVLPC